MFRKLILGGLAAAILLCSGWANATEAEDLYETLDSKECRPALATLQTKAAAGKAESQRLLGNAYLFGKCLAIDKRLAVEWYRKAAELGDSNAQLRLGGRYAQGQGVVKDDYLAAKWYRMAADQGEAGAQILLAEMYRTGVGVAKDERLQVEWIRKAAEQGSDPAQFVFGAMYLNGMESLAKDERLAVEWFRKAAGQGNEEAQSELGLMYEDGVGVLKDEGLAVEWYRKAAELGSKTGQNRLGVMFEDGRGVVQDHAQAAAWYEKAARRGDAWGQRNLARLLREGDGVVRNAVHAHAWLNLASAADEPHPKAAAERDALTQQLTRVQLAEAQRLARGWRPGAALGKSRVAVDVAPTKPALVPVAASTIDGFEFASNFTPMLGYAYFAVDKVMVVSATATSICHLAPGSTVWRCMTPAVADDGNGWLIRVPDPAPGIYMLVSTLTRRGA